MELCRQGHLLQDPLVVSLARDLSQGGGSGTESCMYQEERIVAATPVAILASVLQPHPLRRTCKHTHTQRDPQTIDYYDNSSLRYLCVIRERFYDPL